MHFSQKLSFLIFVIVCLLCSGVRADQYSLQSNSNLLGISYGNGKFVAVGTTGTIITSTDGIKWSASSSGISGDIISVVWGKDKFVAVSKDTTILYSSDGVTWNKILFHNMFQSVTWGNDLFVVLGNYGQILTSSDGIAWTERNSNSYDSYMSIVWTGYKFVVVGSNRPQMNTFFPVIVSSTDGIVWTRQILPSNSGIVESALDCIAWGKSQYYLIVNYEKIFTSSDLNAWTQCPIDEVNINAITFGNSKITTVGSYGRILNSTDDLTWTLLNPFVIPNLGGLNAVAWLNNQIIAVGDACTIWNSSDGINWSNRSLYNISGTKLPQSKSLDVTFEKIKIHNNHVQYFLGQSANIKLNIYNLQGCLVNMLVDSKYSIGFHVFKFPATIPNGRYILSFQNEQYRTNYPVAIMK